MIYGFTVNSANCGVWTPNHDCSSSIDTDFSHVLEATCLTLQTCPSQEYCFPAFQWNGFQATWGKLCNQPQLPLLTRLQQHVMVENCRWEKSTAHIVVLQTLIIHVSPNSHYISTGFSFTKQVPQACGELSLPWPHAQTQQVPQGSDQFLYLNKKYYLFSRI